jgi:uncharacterized protein YjbI with pentapeptide repeats
MSFHRIEQGCQNAPRGKYIKSSREEQLALNVVENYFDRRRNNENAVIRLNHILREFRNLELLELEKIKLVLAAMKEDKISFGKLWINRINFRDSSWEGYDLQGANFTQIDLAGANFRGADLTRANFSGSDFTGVDLSYANLNRTVFKNGILRNAQINGANFKQTNLVNVDMTGATGNAKVHKIYYDRQTVFHDNNFRFNQK